MITLEFLITSIIVVLIPGTGLINTVSTGLVQGRRASVCAALGCTADARVSRSTAAGLVVKAFLPDILHPKLAIGFSAAFAGLGARRVKFVKRWWVMEAPTGQRFCVVRPQRSDFAEQANVWDAR